MFTLNNYKNRIETIKSALCTAINTTVNKTLNFIINLAEMQFENKNEDQKNEYYDEYYDGLYEFTLCNIDPFQYFSYYEFKIIDTGGNNIYVSPYVGNNISYPHIPYKIGQKLLGNIEKQMTLIKFNNFLIDLNKSKLGFMEVVGWLLEQNVDLGNEDEIYYLSNKKITHSNGIYDAEKIIKWLSSLYISYAKCENYYQKLFVRSTIDSKFEIILYASSESTSYSVYEVLPICVPKFILLPIGKCLTNSLDDIITILSSDIKKYENNGQQINIACNDNTISVSTFKSKKSSKQINKDHGINNEIINIMNDSQTILSLNAEKHNSLQISLSNEEIIESYVHTKKMQLIQRNNINSLNKYSKSPIEDVSIIHVKIFPKNIDEDISSQYWCYGYNRKIIIHCFIYVHVYDLNMVDKSIDDNINDRTNDNSNDSINDNANANANIEKYHLQKNTIDHIVNTHLDLVISRLPEILHIASLSLYTST